MSIGLYLHIPFCVSKCPYCDFYSVTATDLQLDAYTEALTRSLTKWAETTGEIADTVYFGGGTPSLLGAKRLAHLTETACRLFSVPNDAEITLEANPAEALDEVFAAFAAAGGNRLSLGMQSASDKQLHTLGRRHTVSQTETAIRAARAAGITNNSLDLMLGTPEQTINDVKTAVACCAQWGASHVSAYLLKLEPGTPFADAPPPLPDEDATVALYHAAAETLETYGYRQYEISNFAKPGFESRHNLKYWSLDPYLGIGPSAHSFLSGKRFAYPRSLAAFMNGAEPTAESTAPTAIPEGSAEEYAMLRLRLTEGLRENLFALRFGTPIPAAWRRAASALPTSLIHCDGEGIRLTREGFLVSNAIVSRLLEL